MPRGQVAQLVHRRRSSLRAKDGRPCNEDVRARLGARLDGRGRDSPVDLHPDLAAAPGHGFTHLTHLGHLVGHERLSAKSRLDSHEQNHVQLGQQIDIGSERRTRLECHAGARAGYALKPGTPFAPYVDLLPELDMVLLMTVEPGFGGQSFMPNQMSKVREVREAVARCGGEVWVQVDGGVSTTTIQACAEAGADVFVAGSAIFGAEAAWAAVDQLRALAER